MRKQRPWLPFTSGSSPAEHLLRVAAYRQSVVHHLVLLVRRCITKYVSLPTGSSTSDTCRIATTTSSSIATIPRITGGMMMMMVAFVLMGTALRRSCQPWDCVLFILASLTTIANTMTTPQSFTIISSRPNFFVSKVRPVVIATAWKE